MNTGGSTRPIGTLSCEVTRNLGVLTHAPVRWKLANFFQHRWRSVPKDYAVGFLGRTMGFLYVESALRVAHYHRPDLPIEIAQRLRRLLDSNTDVRKLVGEFGGTVRDYGVVSTRVVTDTGVAYLVDALQNLTETENLKFHGYGTGGTVEAASQTALVTELTTQYNPDSTRPTGSLTEGASANIFRTVGTLSPDSGGTIAITEHGIFSQAATGGGTMLDRSLFSAVNVVAAQDSLQTTYDLTLASGG